MNGRENCEAFMDNASLEFSSFVPVCDRQTFMRAMNPCLSIVIPTYNEAENIPKLIDEINSSLESLCFEVVFVDDESVDKTADIAEKLNIRYGNIKVLRRVGKKGLGSAVIDGIKKAEAEIIAVMDADLQHPPELLPIMYEKISGCGYDLVVASRYVKGGFIEGWSFRRRIVSEVATMITHLVFPRTIKIKDPMSGYFMFRRDVVGRVKLDAKGFKILLEILVKGNYHHLVEVPYVFKPRQNGDSKMSLKEICNYAILLLKLRMKR